VTIFSVCHKAIRAQPREEIWSCALALVEERFLRFDYEPSLFVIYHIIVL